MNGNEKGPAVLLTTPTSADAEGIRDVFYKTWLATYPNAELGVTEEDIQHRFKNAFTAEGLEKRRAELETQAGDPTFFIARKAGKVVGVCRVAVHENDNELIALYVLPEFHKQGIGRSMWQHAQTLFNPSLPTIVNVAEYNENAIHFYESLGFKDTDKRFKKERFRMESGTIIPEMQMILSARSD